MKKSMLLILPIAFLMSCGGKTEADRIQEQDELVQKYIDKEYVGSKDGDRKIAKIEIKHRDSVTYFSTQDLEFEKIKPLVAQRDFEKKYLAKYEEIDNIYSTSRNKITSPQVVDSRKKVDEIQKKINNRILEIQRLPEDDTVGYIVFYTSDIDFDDMTSKKGFSMGIPFNTDGTLSSELLK